MLPGPDIVKVCPCGVASKERTLASGNTIRATYWTDGYMDAPMLPPTLCLAVCASCGRLLWLDELTKVAEIRRWRPFTEGATQRNDAEAVYRDAPYFRAPRLEEYFQLARNGIADPNRDRYIRTAAWWLGNDSRRGISGPPMTHDERDNINMLAPLLDERIDSDRLIKAEIHRELGEFRGALELLLTPVQEELRQTASVIEALACSGVTKVARIPPSGVAHE